MDERKRESGGRGGQREERGGEADGQETQGPGRKERVIHTRISEALDEEIKAKARDLGVSVSNLVRNVLRNTLGLVGDVVEDTASFTRAAWGEESEGRSGKSSRERGDESAIVGWQQVTLNMNAVCDRCNAILARGGEGAVAVRASKAAATVICLPCLEKIKDEQ